MARRKGHKEGMKLTSQFPAALLLFAAACNSPSSPASIDNALLAELSPETMSVVNTARAEHDAAEDRHAFAQKKTRDARDRRDQARAAQKTRRAQLKESTLALRIAERESSDDRAAAAKSNELNRARADHADELLGVRKGEFEVAKAEEKLAFEQIRLAVVVVELRKVEALMGIDRLDKTQLSLDDHRRLANRREARVASAREQVTALQLKVDRRLQELRTVEERMHTLEAAASAASRKP